MKDFKERTIRIKIPSYWIPQELKRKYRSIVKADNLIKKLKNN